MRCVRAYNMPVFCGNAEHVNKCLHQCTALSLSRGHPGMPHVSDLSTYSAPAAPCREHQSVHNMHVSPPCMHLWLHPNVRPPAPSGTQRPLSTMTHSTQCCTLCPHVSPGLRLRRTHQAPIITRVLVGHTEGAPWARAWVQLRLDLHHGPSLSRRCARAAPDGADAAPATGACASAGCVIGAALQVVGASGRTRRSQSHDRRLSSQATSCQPCNNSEY